MERQAEGEGLLQQVRAILDGAQETVLTTVAGDTLRSGLVPFALGSDASVYFPLGRGDLRALQLGFNPAVSLFVALQDEAGGETIEIEISGKALPLRKASEKQKARDLLGKRAIPIEAGDEQDYVRVAPARIEVRRRTRDGAVVSEALEFPANRRVVSEWTLLGKKAFAWFLAVRMPFLTASITPILLGGAVAWATRHEFSWGLLFLTMLAGALMHLGVNVINDYFDHMSGNDDINVEFIRPFSGGSRVIQMGLLTPLEMLVGAVVLFALSSAIGLYLAAVTGPMVLAFGVVGLVSGVFYVGKPFNWGSHGIGEILVGLNFGTLMTLGAYYVQTQRVDWTPAVAAIPIAALIAAVLYVNEFPDYAADKAVGKRTWVVRLGRPQAANVYACLMAIPYVSVLLAVVAGTLPVTTLLLLITLPLAIRSVLVAYRYHSQPVELAPANALTIVIHLSVGLLLTLGYVWEGSDLKELAYVIGFAVLFTLIVAFVSKGIEQEKRAFLASRQALSAGRG
ncbi:MAG TPA: 1,4-dihydroxy-2-naphthoate octaprenyltransferase [Dehalococcoidia bacterium]|nr:1,4-dihydroxy-2-naphthoate octaprenyltransferase [Dehalococcoidia bacterium]